MRSSHPNAPLSPTVRTRRNTEFPSFPDWANPTALATFCDDLNTLHAADPTTNPATCLAFHSGPWVSVFGLNIDQPGPHLPEGTLWQTWDEGSGTIDITGTRPNHQFVCYIKGNVCPGGIDTAPEGTAACKTKNDPPHDWPATAPGRPDPTQTMPNCAQPSPPALCPCRADGSFPMRRRQRLQLRRVLQPCSSCRWLPHALRA